MNRILFSISSSFLLVNLVIFFIALIDIEQILNIDWFFTYDFIFFPLFIYSIYILIRFYNLIKINIDFKWIKGFGLIFMFLALIAFFANLFTERVFLKENDYYMILEKTKSMKISTELFFSHYKTQVLSESSKNIWFSYISSIVLFLKQKNEK